MFLKNMFYTLTMKCFHGPDEKASRAGFGLWVSVWRLLLWGIIKLINYRLPIDKVKLLLVIIIDKIKAFKQNQVTPPFQVYLVPRVKQ